MAKIPLHNEGLTTPIKDSELPPNCTPEQKHQARIQSMRQVLPYRTILWIYPDASYISEMGGSWKLNDEKTDGGDSEFPWLLVVPQVY